MKTQTTHTYSHLIYGISLALLGCSSIILPSFFLTSAMTAYALASIATGLIDTELFIHQKKGNGFEPVLTLICSVFCFLIGVGILTGLSTSEQLLYVLFPIWFMLHSLVCICNLHILLPAIDRATYILSFICSIAGLFISAVILFDPFHSALSLIYFAGIYLIIMGMNSMIIRAGLKLAARNIHTIPQYLFTREDLFSQLPQSYDPHAD